MKKHLVYAEDLIYEIMQYPSKSLSKGLIHKCADEVIKEKEVSTWKHIWNLLTGKVRK
jgi:hypothetical protein